MKRLKKKSEPRRKNMINLRLSVLSNVKKRNDLCENVAKVSSKQKPVDSTTLKYNVLSDTEKYLFFFF